MNQQKIYDVVKSALVQEIQPNGRLRPFTPWSVVTDVLQIEDPWTLSNLAGDETIGSYILGLASIDRLDPDVIIYVPIDMMLNHYQEIMPVLAANPHVLDPQMWATFLYALPVEHALEHGHGFRLLETQWKHAQQGSVYNIQAYHVLMVKWGMLPDGEESRIFYYNLPPQLRVPRSVLSYAYVRDTSVRHINDVTQEHVDLLIELSLDGAAPSEDNLFGLDEFSMHRSYLPMLRKGIILPKIPPTREMQKALPVIIAWQDGRYRKERNSKVRRIARELEEEFGVRADLQTSRLALPKDLVDMVVAYQYGTLPPVQKDELGMLRVQNIERQRISLARAERRRGAPAPQYVFPDHPEDVAHDYIINAQRLQRSQDMMRDARQDLRRAEQTITERGGNKRKSTSRARRRRSVLRPRR